MDRYIDFDRVTNRWNEASSKWQHNEDYPIDKLWSFTVADMDFLTPQPILDALKAPIEHGILGYNEVMPDYVTSCTNWLKKRHNWSIDKTWILPCCSIKTAMFIVAKALTVPGDHVLYFKPSYSLFPKIASECQLIEHSIGLTISRRISLEDFKKVEALSLMFLCNPHNPTGRVWNNEDLRNITDFCLKKNAILLSDDIHNDLIINKNAKYIPVSLTDQRINNNIIYFMSPGKTFNISGLQTSYLIIPNTEIRNKISHLLNIYGQGTPNTFGLCALKAAYTQCDKWLDALIIYLRENFLYLKQKLQVCEPEIKIHPSEATYLAWLDISGFQEDNAMLEDKMLKKHGIILENGLNFGMEGNGFFRVNYACPRSYLKILTDALYHLVHEKRTLRFEEI